MGGPYYVLYVITSLPRILTGTHPVNVCPGPCCWVITVEDHCSQLKRGLDGEPEVVIRLAELLSVWRVAFRRERFSGSKENTYSAVFALLAWKIVHFP